MALSDALAPLPYHRAVVGGTSRKFWEITVAGATLTVRFGRLGTAGRLREYHPFLWSDPTPTPSPRGARSSS